MKDLKTLKDFVDYPLNADEVEVVVSESECKTEGDFDFNSPTLVETERMKKSEAIQKGYIEQEFNSTPEELQKEAQKWIKELQSDLDEDSDDIFPMDAVDFIKYFFNIDEEID